MAIPRPITPRRRHHRHSFELGRSCVGDRQAIRGDVQGGDRIPSVVAPMTAFRVRRRASRRRFEPRRGGTSKRQSAALGSGTKTRFCEDVSRSRVDALTLLPPRRRSARRRPLGVRLIDRLRDRTDHDAGCGGKGGPARGVERYGGRSEPAPSTVSSTVAKTKMTTARPSPRRARQRSRRGWRGPRRNDRAGTRTRAARQPSRGRLASGRPAMVHERGQVEVDRRVTDAFVNMPHAVLARAEATDEVRGCRRFTVTMTNAAAQATSTAPCNTRWNEEPSRGATFAAHRRDARRDPVRAVPPATGRLKPISMSEKDATLGSLAPRGARGARSPTAS
jgi:hypothetical protein